MTALLEQLDISAAKLKKSLGSTINSHLMDTGQIAYNELFYEFESGNGGVNFALLRDDELRTLIETPVANFKLSERINDGLVPDLQKNIKNELTRLFLNGESMGKVSSRLAEVGYSSYRRAMMITRTEAGRVQAITRQKAQLEAERLDIQFEKQWVATLDKRTRHNHALLDGVRVNPDGYFEINGHKTKQPHMFGLASEDINCRCRTISVLLDDTDPMLRRDNETGEVTQYKNYREWEKAIDRRNFIMKNDYDYLKSKNMISPKKGVREIIRGSEVSFSCRCVLNSNYDMYISDSLGSGRIAFSYYERQINKVLPLINVPNGSPAPRFVLFNGQKDIGKKHNFGAYDQKTNTVFLEATKANEKSILKELKNSKSKFGQSFFAVDNEALSPLIHELGHYKHSMHIKHHAETNGITYIKSKERFNEKLLEFTDKNNYNISEDISIYAEFFLFENVGKINSTNEIISESTVLKLLRNNRKSKKIIDLLESEDW